jgi:hypothetical protein
MNYPGNVASALANGGFTALTSFSVSTLVNGRAAYTVAATTGSYRAAWTLAGPAASGGTTIALRAAAPPAGAQPAVLRGLDLRAIG